MVKNTVGVLSTCIIILGSITFHKYLYISCSKMMLSPHRLPPGPPLQTTKILEDINRPPALLKNLKCTDEPSFHIDIKYHFICDLVNAQRIELSYCPTKNKMADVLTKGIKQFNMLGSMHFISLKKGNIALSLNHSKHNVVWVLWLL